MSGKENVPVGKTDSGKPDLSDKVALGVSVCVTGLLLWWIWSCIFGWSDRDWLLHATMDGTRYDAHGQMVGTLAAVSVDLPVRGAYGKFGSKGTMNQFPADFSNLRLDFDIAMRNRHLDDERTGSYDDPPLSVRAGVTSSSSDGNRKTMGSADLQGIVGDVDNSRDSMALVIPLADGGVIKAGLTLSKMTKPVFGVVVHESWWPGSISGSPESLARLGRMVKGHANAILGAAAYRDAGKTTPDYRVVPGMDKGFLPPSLLSDQVDPARHVAFRFSIPMNRAAGVQDLARCPPPENSTSTTREFEIAIKVPGGFWDHFQWWSTRTAYHTVLDETMGGTRHIIMLEVHDLRDGWRAPWDFRSNAAATMAMIRGWARPLECWRPIGFNGR